MRPSNRLRRRLRRAGWTIARHRKHEIWRCPCGKHQVPITGSASDQRSIKNDVAALRRTGCFE